MQAFSLIFFFKNNYILIDDSNKINLMQLEVENYNKSFKLKNQTYDRCTPDLKRTTIVCVSTIIEFLR